MTATTGRFRSGADDNTGAGYWGSFGMSGQTVYLTKDKKTNFSAFEVYEWHSKQKDTRVRPGQTFDVDWSLMRGFVVNEESHALWQLGVFGYGQYQVTDRRGPAVNAAVAGSTRYSVNALRGATNLILPARKVSVGVKYSKEFSNRSTVEGTSFQVSAGITF
jgi:hypothetical protein